MRVLVTGGAGFLGSHVVERLSAEGHAVSVLDDLSTGRRENVPEGVPLDVADLRDATALARVLEAEAPEAICHFAAQSDVRRSLREPAFDAEVNVVGSLRLLEAATRAGVGKIVYAGSAAAFGEPAALPVDERQPPHPISEYGLSKWAFEPYLALAAARGGPAFTVLRFANAYGPRQDGRGEAGVVAIFAEALLSGRPCTIYGDGAQTRDFVYAGDCAAATERALSRGDGAMYVIGTGVETSVLELHERLAALVGGASPPQHGPARPGEIRRMAFHSARARKDLGWEPETPLGRGLAETLAWRRERRRGANALPTDAPESRP